MDGYIITVVYIILYILYDSIVYFYFTLWFLIVIAYRHILYYCVIYNSENSDILNLVAPNHQIPVVYSRDLTYLLPFFTRYSTYRFQIYTNYRRPNLPSPILANVTVTRRYHKNGPFPFRPIAVSTKWDIDHFFTKFEVQSKLL
jgi:hypothetical protein